MIKSTKFVPKKGRAYHIVNQTKTTAEYTYTLCKKRYQGERVGADLSTLKPCARCKFLDNLGGKYRSWTTNRPFRVYAEMGYLATVNPLASTAFRYAVEGDFFKKSRLILDGRQVTVLVATERGKAMCRLLGYDPANGEYTNRRTTGIDANGVTHYRSPTETTSAPYSCRNNESLYDAKGRILKDLSFEEIVQVNEEMQNLEVTCIGCLADDD